MDGCRRWDAGGHEARAGGAGVLERGSGAGGAGGCGERKRGWVEVSGGGGVSWRVDEGAVDEGGVIGGACDPGHGGGGERGAIWVRCDAREWWFGGHGCFGRGMRYAGAAYPVVGGGCGGAVGVPVWALGFDDGAGGMCESMHVSIVVVLEVLRCACPVVRYGRCGHTVG